MPEAQAIAALPSLAALHSLAGIQRRVGTTGIAQAVWLSMASMNSLLQ
jgi:hypothetical protein